MTTIEIEIEIEILHSGVSIHSSWTYEDLKMPMHSYDQTRNRDVLPPPKPDQQHQEELNKIYTGNVSVQSTGGPNTCKNIGSKEVPNRKKGRVKNSRSP